MTVDRHYDWEKYSWTCSRVFLTTVGPGGPHIIAIWQVHTSPYKSIQVHPAVAGHEQCHNVLVGSGPSLNTGFWHDGGASFGANRPRGDACGSRSGNAAVRRCSAATGRDHLSGERRRG